MAKIAFKQFVLLKEAAGDKDWKAKSAGPPLEKGFIPPFKLRPIIRAFLNSDKIILMHDTSDKPITMPSKALYLVGGAVRDFIKGKSIKDLDLATNATPEQTALILSAAGFKRTKDRSGKSGKELNFPSSFETEDGKEMKVQDAEGDGENDSKVWYIQGRDNSKERKPFVIGASVDGEAFEIATFRKDAKTDNGQAEVDFTDNPKDDADRRDLTINSLYIELDKIDGENKKLYDPTQSGYHDLQHGKVKAVGNAKERFEEDPIRIMRAIRFHCRFSKDDSLDQEIEKAIPNFLNIAERVSLDRIRKEFLAGLLHPDVDSRKYINIYKKTKLLPVVFPDVNFDPTNGVPQEFTDKKDKVLALAWLLQHNPIQKVDAAIAPKRTVAGEEKLTGWQNDERKAVLFLLKLKEFTPDKVYDFHKQRQGTGLSNQQIKEWVDMFKRKGTNQHGRPWWAKQITAFSDHQPSVTWDHAVAAGRDNCPNCKGKGCENCRGTGKIPESERGKVIASMEAEKFKEKIRTK